MFPATWSTQRSVPLCERRHSFHPQLAKGAGTATHLSPEPCTKAGHHLFGLGTRGSAAACEQIPTYQRHRPKTQVWYPLLKSKLLSLASEILQKQPLPTSAAALSAFSIPPSFPPPFYFLTLHLTLQQFRIFCFLNILGVVVLQWEHFCQAPPPYLHPTPGDI